MSKRKLTSASCEELIRSEVLFGDPATFYEGKPLCESCYYEDEPVSTIYYRNKEEPYRISLTRNETDGDFKTKWRPTDAWRGRYELESSTYQRIFSDSILAGHESEAMLKQLNDKVIEEFVNQRIEFTRSFNRTSNLFCTDYDIWVGKEPVQILKAHFILQRIKREVDYDNVLYSTGIIFDRESLGKLQSLLGNKYQIQNDEDVMKLVQEKGENLLQEIAERLDKE